jgi:hypothetical protein
MPWVMCTSLISDNSLHCPRLTDAPISRTLLFSLGHVTLEWPDARAAPDNKPGHAGEKLAATRKLVVACYVARRSR